MSWLGGGGQHCLCACPASSVCQNVLSPTPENAGQGLSWDLNGQIYTTVLSPFLGCTVICLGAVT